MKYKITLEVEDRYASLHIDGVNFTKEMIKYIEIHYDITVLNSEVTDAS